MEKGTLAQGKTPAPVFSFIEKKDKPPGESGGIYTLTINGINVCDWEHWAFSSCGVDSLYNFKMYQYGQSSCWKLLEEHHEALFVWLRENGPEQDYYPMEFLFCISTSQRTPENVKFLSHPCVKEIDHFLNKSHGPNTLHLYRISLDKDFPK